MQPQSLHSTSTILLHTVWSFSQQYDISLPGTNLFSASSSSPAAVTASSSPVTNSYWTRESNYIQALPPPSWYCQYLPWTAHLLIQMKHSPQIPEGLKSCFFNYTYRYIPVFFISGTPLILTYSLKLPSIAKQSSPSYPLTFLLPSSLFL